MERLAVPGAQTLAAAELVTPCLRRTSRKTAAPRGSKGPLAADGGRVGEGQICTHREISIPNNCTPLMSRVLGSSGAGRAQTTESVVLEEELPEDYEPTQEEILEYAKWLGMDPVSSRDVSIQISPGWRDLFPGFKPRAVTLRCLLWWAGQR